MLNSYGLSQLLPRGGWKNGYKEVHSPIVVNAASATATADKEGQMYLDQNRRLPDPHGRSARDQLLPRRNPIARFARQASRLHALLP